MESEAADLRPGWETEPRRDDQGMVCYWLRSGAYGIAGTGDGWWRVIDPTGHPASEWSCFEGSQLRAEELEAAEAGDPDLRASDSVGLPFDSGTEAGDPDRPASNSVGLPFDSDAEAAQSGLPPGDSVGVPFVPLAAARVTHQSAENASYGSQPDFPKAETSDEDSDSGADAP